MIENALPFLPLLLADAGVGLGEDHASYAPSHQRTGAGKAGLVGDVGGGHGAIAKSKRIFFGVAGVQAARGFIAGFRGAVRHPWQRAVEAGRSDAAIGAQKNSPHFQSAAGAETAQFLRHAQENFILEGRAGSWRRVRIGHVKASRKVHPSEYQRDFDVDFAVG